MKNKMKRIVASVCVAATAIAICSAGVLALDLGDFSESAQNRTNEIILAEKENRAPVLSFTQEEKNAMIEQRKSVKQEYQGMSDEEFFASIGREDLIEQQKKLQEKIANDKENERFYTDAKQADFLFREEAAKRLECAADLVTRYNYYPDGLDTAKLDSDEDYMLDFIINVCKAYSEHKNDLSSTERSTIETYLNNTYDTVTGWFPQSEKSMDAYEMIEKTIQVQHYSTSVERR